MLRVLVWVAVIAVVLVFVTQVIVPAVRGKALFPDFRRKQLGAPEAPVESDKSACADPACGHDHDAKRDDAHEHRENEK